MTPTQRDILLMAANHQAAELAHFIIPWAIGLCVVFLILSRIYQEDRGN